MDDAGRIAGEILESADIRVNGDRPWDLHVTDERFFARVLAGGSLALGETYMDGWWDCEALDELVKRILSHDLQDKVRPSPKVLLLLLRSTLVNMQSRGRAYNIGKRHYDLGNDLYRLMLDKGMNYSCGYWKRAKSLDDAQVDKLELVCRKIGLEKGMRVLDIGCGWGGFAEHAAGRYGASVVGITVSKEQAELARERCKAPAGGDQAPGLPRSERAVRSHRLHRDDRARRREELPPLHADRLPLPAPGGPVSPAHHRHQHLRRPSGTPGRTGTSSPTACFPRCGS